MTEKKYLQNIIDDMYIQFVTAVAEGRKLDVEKVRQLADGRVFTGKDAKDKNLIDELGGLQEAVEITSKLVQITGEPKLVYPPKPKKGLLGLLFDDASASSPAEFGSRQPDSVFLCLEVKLCRFVPKELGPFLSPKHF